MPSGLATGLYGYSPQNVAGMRNSMELNGRPINYQQGLTSVPLRFNDRQAISPLTQTNQSFYTAFGARKNLDIELCRQFVENPLINPETGRPIAKNKATYNRLVENCEKIMKGKPIDEVVVKPSKSFTYRNCESRDLVAKILIVGDRKFRRGSECVYNSRGSKGVIKGMGCKQIIVTANDNTEKHLRIEDFVNFQ
jgi:hypothetical protein